MPKQFFASGDSGYLVKWKNCEAEDSPVREPEPAVAMEQTVNSVHRNFRVLALAGPQGRKAIFPALVSFKTKVSAGSESKKWVDLEQEGVSDSERKWIVLVWIQKQQQDSCHCFPPLVSRSNGKDLWALEYPIPTFTELNDFSSVPKPQTAAYHGCAQSTRELALLWHI
ncbi:hypothetical protein CB1_000794010 [Camelus ferus]|nr:hypothetical protein CB1_000794010 [Camelus ferus]